MKKRIKSEYSAETGDGEPALVLESDSVGEAQGKVGRSHYVTTPQPIVPDHPIGDTETAGFDK
jgi:hypothetical protein